MSATWYYVRRVGLAGLTGGGLLRAGLVCFDLAGVGQAIVEPAVAEAVGAAGTRTIVQARYSGRS